MKRKTWSVIQFPGPTGKKKKKKKENFIIEKKENFITEYYCS